MLPWSSKPTVAAPAAAAPTPSTVLKLQQLLDTQQATAILPGLLYFASAGGCLSTPVALRSVAAEAAAGPSAPADSQLEPSAAEVPAAIKEAIYDFYFKDNPFTSRAADGGCKLAGTRTIPTPRAAVGSDAVFVSLRGVPPYLYRPFFADFGPLDMGCCVHFARRLCELLRAVTEVDVCASAAPAAVSASSGFSPGTTRPVVVCASLDAQERVNTACLVGAFCVLCLGWSAAATWHRGFVGVYPGFLAYRDASQGVSNYPLSLMDVWAGLEQGVALGLVDMRTFDLPAFLEGKQQDYSWVVPRRLLAMSSPQDDKSTRTAEVFARRLRPLGVRLVVRLNDNLYDPSPLLRLGIRHVDLPYADGSVPTDAMLLRFLRAVEEHFGETSALVSRWQWRSVPSSATATVARAASASKSTPSAGASHWKSGLQPCSPMHSGTCRGMPEAWTALPSLAPSMQARRPSTAHVSALEGHHSSTLAPGEKGAVAVHCLAGLGRTGTVLAVYMMRHYGFTARAVIGWLRLCRPGSITGVQQQYLDAMERRLRPPPHMLAAMQLNSAVKPYSAAGGGRQFELPSRSTGSPSSRALSSASVLFVPTAAAPASGRGDGVIAADRDHLGTSLQPPLGEAAAGYTRSITAAASFQAHGSVVADARPATVTSVTNGHIKRSDTSSDLGMFADSAASANISGSGPVDLAGVREWKQQRHQLQMRRSSNSSTATLSLSTIRPAGEVLDVVARMPVLGEGNPPNGGASTAALNQDGPVASTRHHHSARPSPRVCDYKYASTYFVAIEQAVGLPRVHRRSSLPVRTSTVRGGSPATHGGVRPATASTSCNTALLGASHFGSDSSGSESSRQKATSAAPASANSCPHPRKGLTSALQRQRPHTATAVASAAPRPRAKQWQRHDELGGAISSDKTGTDAPGDTPPQYPNLHESAVCEQGGRNGKSKRRMNLSDPVAGDHVSAGRHSAVTRNALHPPAVPLPLSPSRIEAGATGVSDGLRSLLLQSPSSLTIPTTSLPMWGRPMLRT
ncbi:hypothetical protein LSCM1_07563 [Leishmania martiniquensis]|uniref:Tyrosine specific protein phosphatases domain-containing protein n=1 Tax=Leishmania martiniquensis TaxID=1580590 RepID=A0A836HQ45_9TRYP|nr:hypothetical protein LSCM1_07563 [Leishmania martiniquensis]